MSYHSELSLMRDRRQQDADEARRTYPQEYRIATEQPVAARWQTPTGDAAVAAALEDLARREAAAARQARACGAKEDAAFFQRNANAYTKALHYWQAGIRPVALPSGSYTLPSQRPDEPGHLLSKDGDWVCTCTAGASMHWAMAMLIGIEAGGDYVAAELVGTSEPEPEPEPTPAAPKTTPETQTGPRCCGEAMKIDGMTYYCPKCRHWAWAN